MQTLRQIQSTISIDDSIFQSKSQLTNSNNFDTLAYQHPLPSNINPANRSNNEELLFQIQRLKRKIIILEKNKKLLQQQLILVQQQMKVRQQKIISLQQQKSKIMKLDISDKEQRKKKIKLDQLIIIVNQKQQYIELISKQLQKKNRQIQFLNQDNQYLKEELSNQKNMYCRFQEIINAQIIYYQSRIQEQQSDLKQKNIENISLKAFFKNLLDKQKEKYQLNIKNQQQKSQINAENMISLIAKYEQLQKKFIKMKEEESSWKEREEQLEQTIGWYKKLMQEAKIQFIHTQLQQEQKFQKQKRQNIERNKLNKMLRVGLKENRNNSNVNESHLTTKTHRIIRNNTQTSSLY